MTHLAGVTTLLAAALLVAPTGRWATCRRLKPRGRQASRRLLPLLVVGIAAGGAIILPPLATVAAGLLGATLTMRYRRRTQRRRGVLEGQALEGALDILVGELRVGAHPASAFGVAAAETGGAVGKSLHSVAARAGLGADVTAGLFSVAAASALPAHWERLAVSWQLASERGLPMSSLMRTAQRDIVERQRFSARVDAGMAGARATATILAGLPVLGIALGQSIGARPLTFLLGNGVGGLLLVVGVGMVCCGLWWSDRITGRLTI